MSVIFIKNQKYKPPLPKGRGTKLCLVEGYKNFEFKISNFEFSKPPAVEGYKPLPVSGIFALVKNNRYFCEAAEIPIHPNTN